MMEEKILKAVGITESLLRQHRVYGGDKCEVALEILIVLHNHDIAEEKMNLLQLRKQLKEKKVTIGVYGRHSNGKTTLLNALLHNSYLPTSRVANTAVPLLVEHGEVEPVLKLGSTTVAGGKQDITEYIKNANASAFDTEQPPGENVDLSLSLRVPLLADASDACKAVFMDTPGFGDTMRKKTAQIAQESLVNSCAYLFVINYEQMQDSGDAAILGYLHSIDQSSITGGRIVFAVTKFDSSYKRDDEPTLLETQQYVKRGLMNLGFNVPMDDIIPISGEWALVARQLLVGPKQTGLLRQARKYLIAYKEKEQPHGESGEGEESIDDEVRTMEVQNVAKELEHASNISILEERLKKIVSGCGDHLLQGIRAKVAACVTGSLHDLELVLQTMNTNLEEVTTKEKLLSEMHKIKSNLYKAVNGTDSRVKDEIERTAHDESQKACDSLQKIIDKNLQDFQKKYETSHQQYTLQDLERDFNEAMNCQEEIDAAITKPEFDRTQRVYEQEVLLKETSKELRKLEDLLKQHLPASGNQIEGLKEDARNVLERIANEEPLQLKHVCTKPNLESWTFVTKFWLLIRKIFHIKQDGDPVGIWAAIKSKGPNPSKDDVESIVKETMEQFHTRCDELYFQKDGIKDQLTKAVFASYCMDVSEKLAKVEDLCHTSEESLLQLRMEKQSASDACDKLMTLMEKLRHIHSNL